MKHAEAILRSAGRQSIAHRGHRKSWDSRPSSLGFRHTAKWNTGLGPSCSKHPRRRPHHSLCPSWTSPSIVVFGLAKHKTSTYHTLWPFRHCHLPAVAPPQTSVSSHPASPSRQWSCECWWTTPPPSHEGDTKKAAPRAEDKEQGICTEYECSVGVGTQSNSGFSCIEVGPMARQGKSGTKWLVRATFRNDQRRMAKSKWAAKEGWQKKLPSSKIQSKWRDSRTKESGTWEGPGYMCVSPFLQPPWSFSKANQVHLATLALPSSTPHARRLLPQGDSTSDTSESENRFLGTAHNVSWYFLPNILRRPCAIGPWTRATGSAQTKSLWGANSVLPHREGILPEGTSCRWGLPHLRQCPGRLSLQAAWWPTGACLCPGRVLSLLSWQLVELWWESAYRSWVRTAACSSSPLPHLGIGEWRIRGCKAGWCEVCVLKPAASPSRSACTLTICWCLCFGSTRGCQSPPSASPLSSADSRSAELQLGPPVFCSPCAGRAQFLADSEGILLWSMSSCPQLPAPKPDNCVWGGSDLALLWHFRWSSVELPELGNLETPPSNVLAVLEQLRHPRVQPMLLKWESLQAPVVPFAGGVPLLLQAVDEDPLSENPWSEKPTTTYSSTEGTCWIRQIHIMQAQQVKATNKYNGLCSLRSAQILYVREKRKSRAQWKFHEVYFPYSSPTQYVLGLRTWKASLSDDEDHCQQTHTCFSQTWTITQQHSQNLTGSPCVKYI